MAVILRFPSESFTPATGLTHPEQATVHNLVRDLTRCGLATGVTCHNDGQFMRVFDKRGHAYFIGREDRMCLLYDPDENLLSESRCFPTVLDALDQRLSGFLRRQAK